MVKKIKILGVDFKVEEVECVSKEMLARGQINHLTCEIRIDKSMPEDAKKMTLMHEIMHAIFDLLGYSELEEDEEKVQGIAVALYQLFSTQKIFD